MDDYKGRKGDLAVFLTIDEGPQYFVASPDDQGRGETGSDEDRASLSSQAGQVFSEFNVAVDRETIIRQYGNNGFAERHLRVEFASRAAAAHGRSRLSSIQRRRAAVRAAGGDHGLRTTRPDLVEKQIDLNPGDPLSPAAMADTQRSSTIWASFRRSTWRSRIRTARRTSKYVLYDLEEARRYSDHGGFGAQFARIGGSNAVTDLSDPGGAPGVSPRVSLDLSRLNFSVGPDAESAGRALHAAEARRAQLLRAADLQPAEIRRHFLHPLRRHVRCADVSVETRGSARRKSTQHAFEADHHFLRFTYRHVGVSNLKIDPLLLPQLAQSVRVGIAAFNLVQDRRDDPPDPHKGIYNTLNVGLATQGFRFADQLCARAGAQCDLLPAGREACVCARNPVRHCSPPSAFRRTPTQTIRFRWPSVSSAAAEIRSAGFPKIRPDRAIC